MTTTMIDVPGLIAKSEDAGTARPPAALCVRLESLRDITIPCEASGDEADMSDEDPRLGAGDGLFPVFR